MPSVSLANGLMAGKSSWPRNGSKADSLGSYIREDHTVKPNVSCQESKSSLPAEYGESANVDAAASEQGATDSTSIARQRADHGAVQAESQSRHDRVVDDLRDESPASFAVQKFKTGRSQFSQCKNYAGPELAIPSRLAGGVRSVEEAIRAIAEMRNKQRDWAKIEDWIWEHLLRCLRVLQYHEQGNGNLLSAVGHRPEKSAYWINSLVEAVAKRIGPWGLLVNCAYSGEFPFSDQYRSNSGSGQLSMERSWPLQGRRPRDHENGL